MERAEVDRRHKLVGKNKCPECEAPAAKIKNRQVPQLIKCECGYKWMTYAWA